MFFYTAIDFIHLNETGPTALRITTDCTHYIIQNQTCSIVARIRRRHSFPSTYAYALDDHTICFGYGLRTIASAGEEEYLQLILHSDGSLTIERDPFVTMPIFYSYRSELFITSNVHAVVAKKLHEPSLNLEIVLEALNPRIVRLPMLINEIAQLGERHKLFVDSRGSTLIQPTDRFYMLSQDYPEQEPSAFRHTFEEHLDSFIQRKLKNQPFAFQVSGGLDSSALPLYMSKYYNINSVLAGLIYPGEFGESQYHKLQTLSAYTNQPLIATPIGERGEYPLSRMLETSEFQTMSGHEEVYLESFTHHAEVLQANGVQILCTGMGGDDIFENVVDLAGHYAYGEAELQRRRSERLSPFLTTDFRQAYVAHVRMERNFSLPLLPLSVLDPAASNNIYIERDIWPVSPFIQTTLYAFCQGLPAYFGDNKNILRAWFYAHEFPEVIYNPKQNEHFGGVFAQAVTSSPYAESIRWHARTSVTAKLGYVDINLLLSTMTSLDQGTADYETLFQLYNWLRLEISLQYI